ncbi:hypothetical protein ACIHDR_33510 [Nocardia sp. NPDC052278]|uniref:hypothetical protein n=1 Tax=unclassified Nocardia TaxID=2637762 RepID=UPI0036BF2861
MTYPTRRQGNPSPRLAAGVIATCPVAELEFLYSARSPADRLETQRLLRELFGWTPMSDRLDPGIVAD